MEQYTPIPNIFFDEWMNIMDAITFKILMAICRKILGYKKHRETRSDYISISQIEKITGLPQRTILRKLPELEKINLIKINKQMGRTNHIFLNITPDTVSDVDVSEVTPCQMTPDTEGSGTPDTVSDTKENKIKETNTKENKELFEYLQNELKSKYLSFTNSKIIFTKKDFIILHNIIKNFQPTKQVIYDKIELLYQKAKADKKGFWSITPTKLQFGWNDLYKQPNQEPYKKPRLDANLV